MKNFLYFSFFLFLLWAKPIAANETRILKIITAPEVREMLDRKEGILITSLTSCEYTIQHIPGSINIPLYEMDNNENLPDNKNTTLIFYCMGKRCLYSKKASFNSAS